MDFYDSICRALQCSVCGRNMIIKGRKVMKTSFDRQLCSDCINNYPEFSDAVEDKVYTIVLQQYMKLLDIIKSTSEAQIVTLTAEEIDLLERVKVLEKLCEEYRNQCVSQFQEPKFNPVGNENRKLPACITNMKSDLRAFLKRLDVIFYHKDENRRNVMDLLEYADARVSFIEEWREPDPSERRLRVIVSGFLSLVDANKIAEQYLAPVLHSDYILVLLDCGRLRCLEAGMRSTYDVEELKRLGFPDAVLDGAIEYFPPDTPSVD